MPAPIPLGEHETRPDPQSLTASSKSPTGVSYEPNPSTSLKIPPEREEIIRKITSLYSGSASEDDMQVYAQEAIYDDLLTRQQASRKLIFKMKQEYTPRVAHFSKPVNSLITLTLDGDGKVKYHKDMWNEKDYSHEGLGKVMKTLNGDYLTKITRPPKDL